MAKRFLVLGANRGIGLELVRLLRARGDEVTAACRRSSAELDALAGVSVKTDIDVRSMSSLEALATELGTGSLDGLIVVAGILRGTSLASLDVDVIREQLEVNAIGPLQATAALRGCLAKGATVGLVTSRMGSIADNTSGGSYGYRMSKAALNMAGRSLAHDLKGDSIAVVLLHPGFVRTEMTGGNGHLNADESATGLLARIDETTLATTGRFVHQSGEELPW